MRWSMKKAIFVLVGFFVLIQFVRPGRTNPPSDPAREISAHVSLDPVIAATLTRSCNDCHSNRTLWPWYSGVAPVSWFVARDVFNGRVELNFSEWGAYSPEKSHKLLGDICNEVSNGEMPKLPYIIFHPRARLNQTDVNVICQWTQRATLRPASENEGN